MHLPDNVSLHSNLKLEERESQGTHNKKYWREVVGIAHALITVYDFKLLLVDILYLEYKTKCKWQPVM